MKKIILSVLSVMAFMYDLDDYGTMHETYHAETGEPLALSNFKYRTANGKIQGFVSWNLCMENVIEGVTGGKWMLLEIDGMD